MLLLSPDDKPQRQTKHIFRLLTKSDLTKDVLDKELFILWPDNAQWYAAEIIKVRPNPPFSPCSHSTLKAQPPCLCVLSKPCQTHGRMLWPVHVHEAPAPMSARACLLASVRDPLSPV